MSHCGKVEGGHSCLPCKNLQVSDKASRLIASIVALVAVVFIAFGAANLQLHNPVLFNKVVLSTSISLLGGLLFWGTILALREKNVLTGEST